MFCYYAYEFDCFVFEIESIFLRLWNLQYGHLKYEDGRKALASPSYLRART